MTETSTIEHQAVEFHEPFCQYAIEWEILVRTTATPDLLEFFATAEQASDDRDLASAYGPESDAELLAAHEDLAEASFRSLPAE
jgi:hypothetical protein